MKSIDRKAFLRVLAALGLAGPALLAATGCGSSGDGSGGDGGGGGGGGGGGSQKVRAFKLSHRGQGSCKGCSNHARFKVFKTQQAANSNRAHAGCNCKIKVVMISGDDANRYFASGPVFDRRSIG